jgi:uncharacterized protein YecE (DUF72 family)
MKFGKVTNPEILSTIDFSLPTESKETLEYLQSLPKTQELKVYIGAPAWGVKSWKGKIYPEKAKPEEFLRTYAQCFNSIELNTTHYRLPQESDIFNWLKEIEFDFKFCPKVTQSISHFGGLTNKDKVEEFFNRMNLLGENLGINFMQLHENFSSKRFGDLSKFIGFVQEHNKVAIELRHPDWFKDDGIFKYLRSKGISTVISDTAGKRDVLHTQITSPTIIVRFVGNNLHETDYTRINAWIEKMKFWQGFGIKEVYFFVHEPEELMCPEISDYLIEKLTESKIPTSAKMNWVKGEEISLL